MPNQVEIQARDMHLDDKIKSHVNKKAGNLDHYLPAIEEAHVQFRFQKSARSAADRNVTEITVRGKGMILRAEERADDPLKAFDAALDDMQRQIERFKGKHYRNIRGADLAKRAAEPEAEQESASGIPALIARRKRFRLQPMNVEEAFEQMRLLGHDNFFLFFNAETGKINVLYQRRDGSYGLIEAEMD